MDRPENIVDRATDVIQALRAERDSLKAKLTDAQGENESWEHECDNRGATIDSLKARLLEAEERYRSLDAGAGALKAERDAAVQLAERLVSEVDAKFAEAADTERRVVEIAEWLEIEGNGQAREIAKAIRAGAYRKQGARDV